MKPEVGSQRSEVKAWWQSKTILGIVGLVAVLIAERADLPVTQDEAGELITLSVGLVSAAVAIFGRVKARKEIKLTVPGGKWNPNAEVRKPKGYRFPKTGGYFMLSAPMAFLVWSVVVGLMFGAIAVGQRHSQEIVTPEKAREWLAVREVEDARHFLVRLADSLTFNCKVKPRFERDEQGTVRLTMTFDRAGMQVGAEF